MTEHTTGSMLESMKPKKTGVMLVLAILAVIMAVSYSRSLGVEKRAERAVKQVQQDLREFDDGKIGRDELVARASSSIGTIGMERIPSEFWYILLLFLYFDYRRGRVEREMIRLKLMMERMEEKAQAAREGIAS